MRTHRFLAQQLDDIARAALNQTQIDGHVGYRLRGEGARQFRMPRRSASISS
jgi:hypothetical protein